jgi:hypothetical protein
VELLERLLQDQRPDETEMNDLFILAIKEVFTNRFKTRWIFLVQIKTLGIFSRDFQTFNIPI